MINIIYTGHPILPSGRHNVSRPTGPFRILKGKEYADARELAKQINNEILLQDPYSKGMEIHEIHPVKLGGSPTDLSNKVYLSKPDHLLFNIFWIGIIKSHSM